jgi:hypothetical protein
MATRQAAEPLAIALRLSTKPVALISRSGSMRPFKVQATWSAAIPQLPQKVRKFFHFCLFLASALRGLSSIYAIYRGRGLGYGRDCFSGGWG